MTKAVTFEARGQVLALRYDFNALCRLEEVFDRPLARLDSILAPKDGEVSLRDLRRLFAVGLDRSATEDEVGLVIDEIGMTRAFAMVLEAIELAMPKAEGGAAGKTRGKTGSTG